MIVILTPNEIRSALIIAAVLKVNDKMLDADRAIVTKFRVNKEFLDIYEIEFEVSFPK